MPWGTCCAQPRSPGCPTTALSPREAGSAGTAATRHSSGRCSPLKDMWCGGNASWGSTPRGGRTPVVDHQPGPGQPGPGALPSKPLTRSVSGHADLSLAARCRDGAPGAFDELYRAHAPRLFGLTCRMVGRPDAEDLLQEIFLTAHRKLAQYKGDSSLGTWLFRLGANLCIDHLRSRGARLSQLSDAMDDDFDAPPGASGPVLGVVDRLDLDRALAGLPPGCRTVFVLHDVEGFEHREIGGLLNISDGTSKSQLHKARLKLRAALTRGVRN